jgi:hypothetical protein
MRSPPRFHVCQDLDTLFSPGLFVHLWSFSFRRLPDDSTLPLPFCLDKFSVQKSLAHPKSGYVIEWSYASGLSL